MPADSRVGRNLGPFQIVSLIGRGGMGVVYLAEHRHLGRRVALKLLAPELAEDESYRHRFERESQLAASLSHPHIVQIYDAGESEGILYIAMQHIPGPDLGEILKRGPLPLARTTRIVCAAADALQEAHMAGVVHRDVKPQNVILAPDRRGHEQAYLSDFGLAKPFSGGKRLTKSGYYVGTIPYSAPEQFMNADVGARADIYSLGCVLFECLTGEVPFPRDHDAAVMHAHLHEPVPKVTVTRPDLPPEVDRIVARSMAKEPADRFNNCRQMGAAIRELQGGRSAASTRPLQDVEVPTLETPAKRGATSSSRPRRPWIATALAFAALAATIAGFMVWRTASESPPGSDSRQDIGETTSSPSQATTGAPSSNTDGQGVSTASPTSSADTEVHIVRPFGFSDTEVQESYQVVEESTATCDTNSSVSNRPDAWRCFAEGSLIYDPCFQPQNATERVACLGAPWSTKVVLLTLTRPLRHEVRFTQDDILSNPPWGVELATGDRCVFISGATGTIAGLRLNYACGEQGENPYLVGEPDRRPRFWRIFFAADLDAELIEHEVVTAWF